MIQAALVLNVLVLLPVCAGIFRGGGRIEAVFGGDSTSRQILACMYSALLLLSLYFLFDSRLAQAFAPPILAFQVVYKVLSLFFIKNRRAPVYGFNLAIAIFHACVLWSL